MPVYSTVDDMQQKIFVVSDNQTFRKGVEHSQPSVQRHNDYACSTIELSLEQEMLAHGIRIHGAVELI